MFERWLDIAYEYRRRLIAALVIVPCLLAAGYLFVDRSQTVTARVWISAPIALMVPGTTRKPADLGASVLRQWLKTDAFADQVLTTVDAGFDTQTFDRQSALRRDLRHNLAVAAEGDRVLVLSYRTDEPAVGGSMLTATIDAFESRAITTLIDQVSAPDPAAPLRKAGTVVQYTFDNLGAKPVPMTAADLRRYFAYLMAQRISGFEVDTVRGALLDQGVLTPGRMALLEQAIFATVDPPSALGRMSALSLSVFGLGLLGVALIELVLITRLAVREERVRSGADVQRRTAIPYLGSTRSIKSPSPHGGKAGVGDAEPAVVERCRQLFKGLQLPDEGATIAVTSPGRGEGRSTIAAGLAIAIARETEQRVLLLDLGVAHAGQDRGPLRRVCDPCAPTPAQPESGERFRWTVVDLPPALPAAAGWIEIADASLLVGRYRSTTVEALSTSAALMPAPPAGFLMTADRGLPEWVRRFL